MAAMKEKILIISQYFYPERFKINDIARDLVSRGYGVTVLTGIPNYPEGKFFKGYGFFSKRKEIWNGIEIIRLPIIPRGRNKIKLILNYYSFPISGRIWSLFTRRRFDRVFMFETSPIMQCMIGVWYKKKFAVPLYLCEQDLWPDNLIAVTHISNRFIIRKITNLVNKVHSSCDGILVPSKAFTDRIIASGGKAEKVYYWPQFSDVCASENRKERAGGGKFVITFAGNIGEGQGLDVLPRAAARLKNAGICNICFRLVGNGRAKEKLVADIKEKGVGDMFSIEPAVNPSEIPAILAASDILFISLADDETFNMYLPAKLQSYMTCGKPILACANGELVRVIEDADCGLCVPAGDDAALADAITEMMKKDKETLRHWSENAVKYNSENFDKQKLMDKLLKIMELE